MRYGARLNRHWHLPRDTGIFAKTPKASISLRLSAGGTHHNTKVKQFPSNDATGLVQVKRLTPCIIH